MANGVSPILKRAVPVSTDTSSTPSSGVNSRDPNGFAISKFMLIKIKTLKKAAFFRHKWPETPASIAL